MIHELLKELAELSKEGVGTLKELQLLFTLLAFQGVKKVLLNLTPLVLDFLAI